MTFPKKQSFKFKDHLLYSGTLGTLQLYLMISSHLVSSTTYTLVSKYFQNASYIFVVLWLSMVICTGSVHMVTLHLQQEMQNYFWI